jgi:hypothetical protein
MSAKLTDAFAAVIKPTFTSRTLVHSQLVSSDAHTTTYPAVLRDVPSATWRVLLLAMLTRITASFVSSAVANASFSLNAADGHHELRKIATIEAKLVDLTLVQMRL